MNNIQNHFHVNIKAGCCYIDEVLLSHLMFADDICVFCPSVRWLQRILDVCQCAKHVQNRMDGIIFNCNKTVCMTFKAKSAKSTATPLLKLGGQYVKSVDQYKYRGIVLDKLSSQMTKTFRDKCNINIVQQTSCEPLFPVVQMQLKMYFFIPSARPCMKWQASTSLHSHGKHLLPIATDWDGVPHWVLVIHCQPQATQKKWRSAELIIGKDRMGHDVRPYASQLRCNFRKSCIQRLRVAYNFGCRALYNLTWRASVSNHQVQCNIPTFEALLRKYTYLTPVSRKMQKI